VGRANSDDKPDAEIADPGQRRPERGAFVEERAEGQVHERSSRSVGDIGANALVRGTGERDRSQKPARAEMVAAYVRSIRVERAKRRLEQTSDSIEEISWAAPERRGAFSATG
jgi:hypothetical protein